MNRETFMALVTILRELVTSKFYGEVLIKFEKGEVTILRKTENIKL